MKGPPPPTVYTLPLYIPSPYTPCTPNQIFIPPPLPCVRLLIPPNPCIEGGGAVNASVSIMYRMQKGMNCYCWVNDERIRVVRSRSSDQLGNRKIDRRGFLRDPTSQFKNPDPAVYENLDPDKNLKIKSRIRIQTFYFTMQKKILFLLSSQVVRGWIKSTPPPSKLENFNPPSKLSLRTRILPFLKTWIRIRPFSLKPVGSVSRHF